MNKIISFILCSLLIAPTIIRSQETPSSFEKSKQFLKNNYPWLATAGVAITLGMMADKRAWPCVYKSRQVFKDAVQQLCDQNTDLFNNIMQQFYHNPIIVQCTKETNRWVRTADCAYYLCALAIGYGIGKLKHKKDQVS